MPVRACGHVYCLVPAAATAAAAVAASGRLNSGLIAFIDLFWGACMPCGQRMAPPSADSAGDQGPRTKDQGRTLVQAIHPSGESGRFLAQA
jgi:hypothetical protein